MRRDARRPGGAGRRRFAKRTATLSAARFPAAAAFLGVLFLPAWAGAAPVIVPTRDVTVTYDVQPKDFAPLTVRVAIEAGGERLRITAENLPTAFLVNRDARQAVVLLPVLKMFSTVPITDREDPERTVLRQARFERGGQEVIAGLTCTDWRAVSPEGKATGCITKDGVILRGHAVNHHGDMGSVRASAVEYGPIPPALFTVPPGYHNAGALPQGLLGLKN